MFSDDNVPNETMNTLYDQANLVIEDGYNIKLTSKGGPWALTQKNEGKRHFIVNGSLTLENVILDSSAIIGTTNKGGVRVSDKGTLTVGSGAVIKNCYNSTGGGVDVEQGGTLNISGGEISGNKANYGGGVYLFKGGKLVINSGTISDNTGNFSGGGVYAASDLGNRIYSNVTIKNATISGNHAVSGGGIYGYASPFTISGSTISGNWANDAGGGISSDANSITISGSTISGNWANGYGGGIHTTNTSGTLTIDDNTSITSNGVNSAGITKTAYGGGIYAKGTLCINSGVVSGNTVTGDGGGVYTTELKKLYISEGVEFANNKASIAYERDPNNNYINILCTKWTYPFTQGFNNYDINQYGTVSGIYAVVYDGNGKTGGDVPIDTNLYKSGDDVIAKEAGSLVRTDHKFEGWKTSATGKELQYKPGDKFKISNHVTLYAHWIESVKYTVTYNGNGGTLAVQTQEYDERAAFQPPANPARDDYIFTGWNTSADGKGTSYSEGTTINSDLTLYAQWEPIVVTYKIISLDSGGSYETEWTRTLVNGCAVQPNAANPSGDESGYPANYSAPVWYENYIESTNMFSGDPWNFNSKVTADLTLYAFDNVAYDNNSAVRTIKGYTDTNGKVTAFTDILIRKSIVLEQVLNISGDRNITFHKMPAGRVTITTGGNYRHFEITGGGTVSLTFDGNVELVGQLTGGGGISVSGNNTVVSLNNAYISDCKNTNGGAVAVDVGGNGKLTMNNCVLNHSTASGRGGGVYVNAGDVTVNSGTISNNTADVDGGGVYVNAGKLIVLGVSGGTITGNTAYVNGGGVYVNGGEITVNGKMISNNTAYGDGGGVYVNDGKTTVNSGTISSNTAYGDGGGVYVNGGGVYVNTGKLAVYGGTISGNSANGEGGGIFTKDFSRITVDGNVAFSGNTAGQAYWLENYVDKGIYDTGNNDAEITIGDLKALHNGTNLPARWGSRSLSDPGEAAASLNGGGLTVFSYLANNFDLNFVGPPDSLNFPRLKIAPLVINYGTGTIPVRRTLFGLKGSTHPSRVKNLVINEDASEMTKLEFIVANPKAKPWTLSLHCTPFAGNDKVCDPRAKVVAVDSSGKVSSLSSEEDAAIIMYNSESFLEDLDNGLANYDDKKDEGTWTWDRFEYDIHVETTPGSYHVGENYKSVFTWTFTVGP